MFFLQEYSDLAHRIPTTCEWKFSGLDSASTHGTDHSANAQTCVARSRRQIERLLRAARRSQQSCPAHRRIGTGHAGMVRSLRRRWLHLALRLVSVGNTRRDAIFGNPALQSGHAMIRKLKSGQYRLYSRKINPATKRPRNLGTFKTRAAAEKHEREVQYFKKRS
jgi:hypothetical protein